MATQIEVPSLGESVKQAILVAWHKNDGETVSTDEPICALETHKANVGGAVKTAGILRRLKGAGETANVGEVIARIDEGPAGGRAAPAASSASAGSAPKPAAASAPSGQMED